MQMSVYLYLMDSRIHAQRIILIVIHRGRLGMNGRGFHRNGNNLTRGQVQGKVMSIAFVHNLGAKIGTVDNVCPGVDDTTFGINHALIEIKPIQV
jgi:hypothetical protein